VLDLHAQLRCAPRVPAFVHFSHDTRTSPRSRGRWPLRRFRQSTSKRRQEKEERLNEKEVRTPSETGTPFLGFHSSPLAGPAARDDAVDPNGMWYRRLGSALVVDSRADRECERAKRSGEVRVESGVELQLAVAERGTQRRHVSGRRRDWSCRIRLQAPLHTHRLGGTRRGSLRNLYARNL